jgi:hypothetical protein
LKIGARGQGSASQGRVIFILIVVGDSAGVALLRIVMLVRVGISLNVDIARDILTITTESGRRSGKISIKNK